MNTALLKSVMALNGMNQRELASRLSRTETWVSLVFKGKSEFTLADVRLIKQALNLTAEQIDSIFFA